MKRSERVAVVTGTASGMGAVIARALAESGIRVLAHARTAQGAEMVAEQLNRDIVGDLVTPIAGDLASLAGVAALSGQALTEAPDGIDIVVHNAGAAFSTRRLSEDGVEATLAVNHIAVAALTDHLLPALRTAARRSGRPSRVIAMSSYLEKRSSAPEDWSATGRYNQLAAYLDSKHINLAYLYKLARDLDPTEIVIAAADPGAVRTAFQRKAGGLLRVIGVLGAMTMVTPEVGAATAIDLATRPDDPLTAGYYRNGRLADSSAHSRDAAYQDEVWERTVAIIHNERDS